MLTLGDGDHPSCARHSSPDLTRLPACRLSATMLRMTCADESSWGTYCPPDDMVDGVAVGSCLGDLYSVNWMEDR